MTTKPFTPTKLYYKIGEVCKILGVEAYVLRYWETEFPALSPQKNRSGQRTYRPKDIELLLQIRKLLYEDGFTIAGARKQLGHRQIDKPMKTPDAGEQRVQKRRDPAARPRREPLSQVREELENILTLLDNE
jgi:DNA-binding transcriptional MerR regulator